MTKEDRMFEELGIKQKLIHDDKVLFLHNDSGLVEAYLDLEIKEFAIDINRYAENTIKIHLAIHQKLISKPPLKIISKNGSDDSLDFTVECPTCKSHRNYGTEIFMLSGEHYCNTIGCREKCISNNKVKY